MVILSFRRNRDEKPATEQGVCSVCRCSMTRWPSGNAVHNGSPCADALFGGVEFIPGGAL